MSPYSMQMVMTLRNFHEEYRRQNQSSVDWLLLTVLLPAL